MCSLLQEIFFFTWVSPWAIQRIRNSLSGTERIPSGFTAFKIEMFTNRMLTSDRKVFYKMQLLHYYQCLFFLSMKAYMYSVRTHPEKWIKRSFPLVNLLSKMKGYCMDWLLLFDLSFSLNLSSCGKHLFDVKGDFETNNNKKNNIKTVKNKSFPFIPYLSKEVYHLDLASCTKKWEKWSSEGLPVTFFTWRLWCLEK